MNMACLKSTVTTEEWQLRCNQAACYRLGVLCGWSDLVFTHISGKLPASGSGVARHFLINPCGLMFDEITASYPHARGRGSRQFRGSAQPWPGLMLTMQAE